MAHYCRAVYEQTLFQTQKFRMPAFDINHITRAVALGYLVRQIERSTIVAELLQLGPDFEKSQRETKQHIWRYEQPSEWISLYV